MGTGKTVHAKEMHQRTTMRIVKNLEQIQRGLFVSKDIRREETEEG